MKNSICHFKPFLTLSLLLLALALVIQGKRKVKAIEAATTQQFNATELIIYFFDEEGQELNTIEPYILQWNGSDFVAVSDTNKK